MRLHVTALTITALIAPLISFSAEAQQRRVEYEISFPNAANHEALVSVRFTGVPRNSRLRARMARTSPGRYALTSFAKNVYDVRATDGRGRPLPITRPDMSGWDVGGHDGTVRLTYTVWGDRVDGTYLGIDESHAHMNMPATFMYARGMESAPVRLTIRPRTGWKVATQLAPTSDSMVFTAPNMQWFLDSPTEVGPVTFRSWTVRQGGRASTLRLAVHHQGTEAQVDSFTTLVRRVVDESIELWGEPPGFDHGTYTFLMDYLPWVNGDGMEHRNSTVISGRGSLSDSANRVARLGTVSHEFFHAWNMERLRARSLEPFDFDNENMSEGLWLGEGFTNYFGPLIIRRAGLYTDDDFARNIGSAIAGTVNNPGRKHYSAVGMSLQAPFRDGAAFPDPINPNTFISYYTWGSVIALGLDLTLRDRFNASLDDYMRLLWRDFGKAQSTAFAPVRPYTMRDLRAVLGKLTKDTAFANDFFRRYIEGSDVPDFSPLLARAGFQIPSDSVLRPFLGASLANDSAGVFVNWTAENGSMYQAGIANGAIVHAIGGVPVASSDSLNAVIARHRVGETVTVDVTRVGRRQTIPMRLVGLQAIRVVTYESAGLPVTAAMRAFRRSWLGGKAAR